MAGTVGRVEDLVVEDGEVEGQAEADGVSRGQLCLGNVGSALFVETSVLVTVPKREKRINESWILELHTL